MEKRILLLITDLEIGGTPTVVRELAIRLRAATGAHIEVACLAPWGPVADQLETAGIRVTALGAKNVADLLVIRRLAKLIHSQRIDTVFSFLVHANAVASCAKAFCEDVRWIQSIQTTQPDPQWHWWLQGLIHDAAEKIVVPSNSVAEAARERSDVPAAKIVVIPNAIDLNDFHPVARNWGFMIGFLGRLDPIKRVGDLIEAMTLLDGRFKLGIFGDGPERAKIMQQIERLHLENRITLHGAVRPPSAALQQMDMLVLPSQAEGFPLVLIEAMAMRVPIVATDAGGIRDVIDHEKTGLLIPVAQPAQLAAGIRRMAEDGGLRSRMIAQASAAVKSRFTWDHVLPQYRSLLDI